MNEGYTLRSKSWT